MTKILVKDNLNEIFEEVNNYVDEDTELDLLRIDDKLISISVDEDGFVYFTVKGDNESKTVMLEGPNPDYYAIRNAFDALIVEIKNN